MLLLIGTSRNGTQFLAKVNIQSTTIFWSLTVALNLLLTTLIVLRIVRARKAVRSALGPDHTSTYYSVAAMLVESSALFSIFGLAFVISLPINNNNVSLIVLAPFGLLTVSHFPTKSVY